jgi:hypothetical protein
VLAEWDGEVAPITIMAHQTHIMADGQTIAEHARCFSYDQSICNSGLFNGMGEKARRLTPRRTVSRLGFATRNS